ncbi:unnamed protein product [Ixodes hexagonus]
MPSCVQLFWLSVAAATMVQALGIRPPVNVSLGAPPRAWQFGSTPDDAQCTSATSYQTWILSIAAACVVGLSGIFPLVLVPVDAGTNWKHNRKGSRTLKLLLSFAVGGLLGDVFLHLLPEAWGRLQKGSEDPARAHLTLGLWVLLGVFTFVILELVFSATTSQDDRGVCRADINQNGVSKGDATSHSESLRTIHVAGYLNLLANSIDNFTHGLAVAASFLVGIKMGMVTTLAILIHEIPHEVGDFAILLKSGFSRWDAAKAQVSTAVVGVAGAVAALTADSMEVVDTSTSWILPFTSGGFLNIALVSVLPDLLKEEDAWESSKQLACVCSGIAVMAAIQAFLE